MTAWLQILAEVPAAAAVLAWGAYHPASRLFGPALCRTASPNTIALTFDDGPNPAITPRLLGLLDRHEVHATFFLIGRWARACPAIVRDIAADGHAIGNHTETHPNLLFLSRPRIVTELTRCQQSIADITGTPPSLLRPPYGARGPQLRRALGAAGLTHVVTWTTMGRDWSTEGKRRLVGRLARVRGGEIIVLHDGCHRALDADRLATIRALEHWLPRWKDAGLHAVRL